MKKAFLVILGCLLITVVSCKKDKKETETTTQPEVETTQEENKPSSNASGEERKVTLKLEPKSGSTASGSVVFKEKNGVVTMVMIIGGLSEGEHAVHLHESADCSAEDGTSTGGHWNPTKEPHGKWGSEEGYHKGDIGNFTADANGNGTLSFVTSEWCIGCGDPNKDILGKAVIVHEGADDFKTQPTGAAGGRISCGGIIE